MPKKKYPNGVVPARPESAADIHAPRGKATDEGGGSAAYRKRRREAERARRAQRQVGGSPSQVRKLSLRESVQHDRVRRAEARERRRYGDRSYEDIFPRRSLGQFEGVQSVLTPRQLEVFSRLATDLQRARVLALVVHRGRGGHPHPDRPDCFEIKSKQIRDWFYRHEDRILSGFFECVDQSYERGRCTRAYRLKHVFSPGDLDTLELILERAGHTAALIEVSQLLHSSRPSRAAGTVEASADVT